MAPITCKVTDITNVGLRGLHVVLDCFDQCQNPLAKFESFTDHNGLINSWLPAPQAGESSVINPQDVDAHSYPRVSLTFFPGPYHTANGAWVSIRTDLYLLGIDQHHIVLRINDAASYHLEHHKISSNPPASSNVDADLFADISSPVTSSPVRRHSRPMYPPTPEIACGKQPRRSRKRKLRFCDEIERPMKRARR